MLDKEINPHGFEFDVYDPKELAGQNWALAVCRETAAYAKHKPTGIVIYHNQETTQLENLKRAIERLNAVVDYIYLYGPECVPLPGETWLYKPTNLTFTVSHYSTSLFAVRYYVNFKSVITGEIQQAWCAEIDEFQDGRFERVK